MLDNIFGSNMLGIAIWTVVNPVLWVSLEAEVVPEGNVNSVVCHTLKLAMHRASGALFLIGPGLSPRCPEFSCWILLGEVFEFSVGPNLLCGHQKDLTLHGNGKAVGLTGSLCWSHLAHPIGVTFI